MSFGGNFFDFSDPMDRDKYPHRPDHPDFWKLSQTVLALDGAIQEAGLRGDTETADRNFERAVGQHIDRASLIYMASQRALRIAENREQVTKLTALYIDAFMVACNFKDPKWPLTPNG